MKVVPSLALGRDQCPGQAWPFRRTSARPPFAQTTGSGRALVLRNGQAWPGRWSRPRANDGTTFTTAAGGPMNFARGQVWIVLAYP